MQYTPTNYYTPKNSRIFDFSDTQNLLRYRRLLAQNLFGDTLAKNYDTAHNDTTIRQRTRYKRVKSRVQVAVGYVSSRG
ncbi:hypothetical protein GCM10011514_44660 [Emticicia aquatilis]|uniref:Uncharacterized protein n=1 Tax=Emticicia aquatilis TaxID=1537369 RepID=A0A917DX07_9BACT|nr:hypothetical protein GCM10011514_44660 [Emticicia aquatilis]